MRISAFIHTALCINQRKLTFCSLDNFGAVHKHLSVFLIHDYKITHCCSDCASACTVTENNADIRHNTAYKCECIENLSHSTLSKCTLTKSYTVGIKHSNDRCTHFCGHIKNLAHLFCIHLTHCAAKHCKVLRIHKNKS